MADRAAGRGLGFLQPGFETVAVEKVPTWTQLGVYIQLWAEGATGRRGDVHGASGRRRRVGRGGGGGGGGGLLLLLLVVVLLHHHFLEGG